MRRFPEAQSGVRSSAERLTPAGALSVAKTALTIGSYFVRVICGLQFVPGASNPSRASPPDCATRGAGISPRRDGLERLAILSRRPRPRRTAAGDVLSQQCREVAMQLKSIPWWLWLVPITSLLLAIERMPYGYYTLTRIVVCGFAAGFAYIAWDGGSMSRIWATVLGFVAVLFNPIFPIYLARKTWHPIDIGVAVIFAAHLASARLGWIRPGKGNNRKCEDPSLILKDERRNAAANPGHRREKTTDPIGKPEWRRGPKFRK